MCSDQESKLTPSTCSLVSAKNGKVKTIEVLLVFYYSNKTL